MKIMHVILSQGFAGSERSTAESCNEQARCGHEVRLVVRRSHRAKANAASILDHIEPAVSVRVVPDRLFTGLALGRAIREFAPDVVHTHLRRATRLVVRARPAAATVATLHLSVNGPQYLELDGLICNANWQRESIPPGYRGRVFKMSNSLIPHRRLTAEERLACRAELGIAPDELLVGGVGRLAHSKGWDVLIRAFESVAAPGARLVIFGEGRERPRLESLAGPRVLLPGFHRNVKDWYQVFDLFVCPSRREPLPRVILEALDGGTPVIASTADGCRELIEQYGGELFEIEDVEGLARLLRRSIEQPPPRVQVDLTAHHVENVTRAYLQAYETLLQDVRARRAARAG